MPAEFAAKVRPNISSSVLQYRFHFPNNIISPNISLDDWTNLSSYTTFSMYGKKVLDKRDVPRRQN